MNKSSLISAAVALAATQLISGGTLAQGAGAKPGAKADAKMAADKKSKTGAAKAAAAGDPNGKCYGVVGAGAGECMGKDPATGKEWDCAGSNPTPDLGWKKMKKSECDAMPMHKDAKAKNFVPDKG